jgi:hypothetical protein
MKTGRNSFKRSTLFLILVTLFFSLYGKSDSDPFTGSVSVEPGENVVNWESQIFGAIKDDAAEEESLSAEKKESPQKDRQDIKTEHKAESPTVAETVSPKLTPSEKSEVLKEEEVRSANWGSHYGPSPVFKEVELKEERAVASNEVQEEAPLKDESSMFPIDLILYGQGGENYVPMINAGLKLSYWNLFSSISIGTDFSASLGRPMGVNMFVGGFYRFWDISVNAALGYEKVWDFSEEGDFENYSLGFKTGLNYHMFSWMSVSAGAGVNYCIMKEATFVEGKFMPMIFGGFEFSLIK